MLQVRRNVERHSQIIKNAYYFHRLGAVRVYFLTAALKKDRNKSKRRTGENILKPFPVVFSKPEVKSVFTLF